MSKKPSSVKTNQQKILSLCEATISSYAIYEDLTQRNNFKYWPLARQCDQKKIAKCL